MRTSDDLLNRLRAEFLDMPRLCLTRDQVQRLCGVERTMCQMMLDALVDEKFLCVKSDGHYARLTTGHHPHSPKAKYQPARAQARPERRRTPTERSATAADRPTKAQAILLVQPERDDRAMYLEAFRHEGFVAIPVSTVADALRVARHVDVVVTGILLPGGEDGIELVKRIKQGEPTTHIPVIVLTTCAWASDQIRAVAAGCDVFLAKPCLPEELLREVRRLLSLPHTRRRIATADVPHDSNAVKGHSMRVA